MSRGGYLQHWVSVVPGAPETLAYKTVAADNSGLVLRRTGLDTAGGASVTGSRCPGRPLGEFCSGGRTRTSDLQVMNLAGYQLPYPASQI